ncbi:hypothetical protein FSARC_8848 [Fusarium sarcochroum]|uniref:Beta-lactamase-related domain-containing protein n=1 Tax=Fusarium sarcochroum TaxID=1208366 RepID=A0A8H4TS99_9HYPO|nr:hypothetical protein FSARC_8848 [Fusarium sarcochroum]
MIKLITYALFPFTACHPAQAQMSPDCPLWGPVYPVPVHVHKSPIIAEAIGRLEDHLNKALDQGTLGPSNASFHLEVFSADHILFNYSYAAPEIEDSLTKGILDRDTVFRIGSVSKFVAVYTFLAAACFEYLNDPVTRWVPELAASPVVSDNNVDQVQWHDITLGALAGHQAGLFKDFSLEDISSHSSHSTLEMLGLPTLSPKEIPACGSGPDLRACSRKEFFKDFKTLHPVTSPYNMPIYSNAAFQILAYALEGITNKTFPQVFDKYIRQPLKLNATYLSTPSAGADINAIIPGDVNESRWNVDVGDTTSSAQGFMFSSGADMAAIGQSVLASSLLSQLSTRRWLKPISNTPDLRFAVGMPWEIRRMELPAPKSTQSSSDKTPTRLLDLYTKNGGLGAYYAQIALSPDHGLGFTVTQAGRSRTDGSDTRFQELSIISEMITDVIVPAFEAAAAEQVTRNLAGTYSASDGSGMKITIVGLDGHLGLGVQNWTMGDLDLLVSYYAALSSSDKSPTSASPGARLRLYPVGLHGNGQVAFRGVYGPGTNESSFLQPNKPWMGGCAAWGSVGEPAYGNVGLDDFVFDVNETGKAVAVTARGVRQTLQRHG